MKIAIAADHAGFELKEWLKANLPSLYFQDFGTTSSSSMDYPDVVHPLCQAIEKNELEKGILICGSAQGVAMTANKHAQIRAAVCWNEEIATLCRQHNDANVLCLPARFITTELAKKCVELFLFTPFEGGRHAVRVGKIAC